jgi:hypothetical protein
MMTKNFIMSYHLIKCHVETERPLYDQIVQADKVQDRKRE